MKATRFPAYSTTTHPPTSIGPYSDRKSTRLNSSHGYISYAVFCLKKQNFCHLGTPSPCCAAPASPPDPAQLAPQQAPTRPPTCRAHHLACAHRSRAPIVTARHGIH